MAYLVDANVLSEAAKPRPNEKVVSWLRANESEFFVDPVILGEIDLGILLLPGGRKRDHLESWFQTITSRIECLAWDAAVSRRWARLVADMRRKGRSLPVLDSMIAATALVHDLTLATHNTRDFKKAGVAVFDPFL
jgi:predicted nucleic acid-binding protein